MASITSSTSTSSTDSATISASDFLTLLVTELQNQDPTASTDPNEYVNQLVSVNSLEQLININQTLTTDLGSSTTSSTKSSSSGLAAGAATAVQSPGANSATPASTTASTIQSSATAAKVQSGNLSVPGADAAAQRVANALNGQRRPS
jgi:flagellar basal-body rod modification protein FlgD